MGSRKAHHFWKMEGIGLAKVVIGTPCNAYISENSVMSSEWERCVLDRVCICLHVFVSKKIHKRKLTESSAQNIFGDPRYSQVSPWVSVGFPGKKRSIGLRCRPPHACIHLEKFMYSLALVSGAPHKAYIFRFNTPTNNTFPASGTHTCLILRGCPPPSSHTFLAKSEGVNPPLMFIHYQKCRIHPP